MTQAIFGAGPITHYTGNGWVLDTTDAQTLRLRSTASSAKVFSFNHPAPTCGAQPIPMVGRGAFVATIAASLSATFCPGGEGLMIQASVVEFNPAKTTWFRCFLATGNHNVCQRYY